MTIRNRLLTVLCALLTVGLFPPLIGADEPAAKRKLIPGYIDSKGVVHPEKVLSYVDALQRADDARKAEAHITTLDGQIAQLLATLKQTRRDLAQQTQRAETGEALADTRASELIQLNNRLKANQGTLSDTLAELKSTTRSLTVKTTQAALLDEKKSRLEKENAVLVTSVQQSQARASQLSVDLTRAKAATAKTVAERDVARKEAATLTVANTKLDGALTSTTQQLEETRKAHRTTKGLLADANKTLAANTKALADNSKSLAENIKTLADTAKALANAKMLLAATGTKLSATEKKLAITQTQLEASQKKLADSAKSLTDARNKLAASDKKGNEPGKSLTDVQ